MQKITADPTNRPEPAAPPLAPPRMAERFSGPGLLCHIANLLVLLVSSAVLLRAQHEPWTIGSFLRVLARGEPGAMVLSLGALLFAPGAEAYHRGASSGRREVVQLGDAATAFGSLGYGWALMIYGESIFAAVSSCLLFGLKATLAAWPLLRGQAISLERERILRRCCVIARLPSIAIVVGLLAQKATAHLGDAGALVLAALLMSYLLCATADLVLGDRNGPRPRGRLRRSAQSARLRFLRSSGLT